MQVCRDWGSLQRALHSATGAVGFVPTMGSLHAGHESLLRQARHDNATVVLSVFVNPKQFNETHDWQHYPRDEQQDLALAQRLGVDIVWLPDVATMYPDDDDLSVVCPQQEGYGEGVFRPGHFAGVATVVLKLLLQVQPERAYFGQKDYQQLLLVRQLVAAFFLKTQVVGCPVVREASGLALSSRNRRLSESGRQQAAQLFQVVSQAETVEQARSFLEQSRWQVDYVIERDGCRLVAAWLEGVRLIDAIPMKTKER